MEFPPGFFIHMTFNSKAGKRHLTPPRSQHSQACSHESLLRTPAVLLQNKSGEPSLPGTQREGQCRSGSQGSWREGEPTPPPLLFASADPPPDFRPSIKPRMGGNLIRTLPGSGTPAGHCLSPIFWVPSKVVPGLGSPKSPFPPPPRGCLDTDGVKSKKLVLLELKLSKHLHSRAKGEGQVHPYAAKGRFGLFLGGKSRQQKAWDRRPPLLSGSPFPAANKLRGGHQWRKTEEGCRPSM